MKAVVAVDLDGTLVKGFDYSDPYSITDPLPGAKEFMQELASFADIVIFTSRCSEEFRGRSPQLMRNEIEKWACKHDIPFEEIWTGNGKVAAHAYIDDRAVPCRPLVQGIAAFNQALREVKSLCV